MPDITKAEPFSVCLSRLRNARGLSQKALALAAHMDQSYLAGLETGRRPPPRDKQLLRLATALKADKVEIAQLFEARAMSKMAALGCQTATQNMSPLMHLITVAADMSVAELKALYRIARTLRSLRSHDHVGRPA